MVIIEELGDSLHELRRAGNLADASMLHENSPRLYGAHQHEQDARPYVLRPWEPGLHACMDDYQRVHAASEQVLADLSARIEGQHLYGEGEGEEDINTEAAVKEGDRDAGDAEAAQKESEEDLEKLTGEAGNFKKYEAEFRNLGSTLRSEDIEKLGRDTYENYDEWLKDPDNVTLRVKSGNIFAAEIGDRIFQSQREVIRKQHDFAIRLAYHLSGGKDMDDATLARERNKIFRPDKGLKSALDPKSPHPNVAIARSIVSKMMRAIPEAAEEVEGNRDARFREGRRARENDRDPDKKKTSMFKDMANLRWLASLIIATTIGVAGLLTVANALEDINSTCNVGSPWDKKTASGDDDPTKLKCDLETKHDRDALQADCQCDPGGEAGPCGSDPALGSMTKQMATNCKMLGTGTCGGYPVQINYCAKGFIYKYNGCGFTCAMFHAFLAVADVVKDTADAPLKILDWITKSFGIIGCVVGLGLVFYLLWEVALKRLIWGEGKKSGGD